MITSPVAQKLDFRSELSFLSTSRFGFASRAHFPYGWPFPLN